MDPSYYITFLDNIRVFPTFFIGSIDSLYQFKKPNRKYSVLRVRLTEISKFTFNLLMGFYRCFTCKDSCDDVLWNKQGNELFVTFYDRIDANNLKGSIAIYECSAQQDCDITENDTYTLTLKNIIDHKNNGILNICAIEENVLALADSSGRINMLISNQDQSNTYEIKSTDCAISEWSMCLYMDYIKSSNHLWYSCQNGHIGVAKYNGATDFQSTRIYTNGHRFEAWYVCCFDDHIAISGGDDGQVFIWDSRVDQPSNKITKYFNMGVTSIVTIPHYNTNNMFMIGSFDESITLWDIRSLQNGPTNKFDSLGGQLWRMKWDSCSNSSNSTRLACAMMQSKSCVLDFNPMYNDLEIVYRSNSKAQLVYGVAWHPTIPNLLVSCSHKDKLLELFTIL